MREVVPEEELEKYVTYVDGYSCPEEDNILVGIVKSVCGESCYKPVDFIVYAEDYENLEKVVRAAGIRRPPQWYIASTVS